MLSSHIFVNNQAGCLVEMFFLQIYTQTNVNAVLGFPQNLYETKISIAISFTFYN